MQNPKCNFDIHQQKKALADFLTNFKVDTTPLFTLVLCSGAAAGLAFAVPSKRFRSELHSVPEGKALPLAEIIVRAAVGIGLGVAAGVGHKERRDFNHFLNVASNQKLLPLFFSNVWLMW